MSRWFEGSPFNCEFWSHFTFLFKPFPPPFKVPDKGFRGASIRHPPPGASFHQAGPRQRRDTPAAVGGSHPGAAGSGLQNQNQVNPTNVPSNCQRRKKLHAAVTHVWCHRRTVLHQRSIALVEVLVVGFFFPVQQGAGYPALTLRAECKPQ